MIQAGLEIPRDVAPGPGWSAQMCELADYIGAYDTLRLCEAFGGQELYISANPARSPFTGVIGAEKASIITRAFSGNVLAVPTARYALALAKRAPLIEAARAGSITIAEAARRLGLRRDYVSRLVNNDAQSEAKRPSRSSRPTDGRQLDMFVSEK
ncbi:MAG: hypothetical protein K2X76_00870 [Sphingomonas sp.]|nr:hypothetical protein [Sphingomonas sp.]